MSASLACFHILRPEHEIPQETALEWMAEAHAQAEGLKSGWVPGSDLYLKFYKEIKRRIGLLGVGRNKVQKRGIQPSDLTHQDWDSMVIYRLRQSPQGVGHGIRSLCFDRFATKMFDDFYPEASNAPKHLIHVTCTGYCAPSAAQKLVSKRNFGHQTVVTHAYHMGCYASLPAIRMGLGFFYTPSPLPDSPIDIVHTEICSLHMDPLAHTTEQLVIQTLFGDGFVKYSLLPSVQAEKKHVSSLKILNLHEETIADSADSMSWHCVDWGMQMKLALEVPTLIAKALPIFLKNLLEPLPDRGILDHDNVFFAIHPGGPKIIIQIAGILNLKPAQTEHSRAVLKEFGNMSSATLPHIWNALLNDCKVPYESKIISLAFGPGLSISGAVFEKKGAG